MKKEIGGYLELEEPAGQEYYPDLCGGNLGEFLRQCIRHGTKISKGHERIAESDLTAGDFLYVILDILRIRSNDRAVVMVVGILELVALIE